MAKGKHAAAAARGRYESAVEHIDRLTTELAEAKLRARMVEREAAQVPALKSQIEALRADVASGSSNRVRLLERELAEARDDQRGIAIADWFVEFIRRDEKITGESTDALRRLIGGLGAERFFRHYTGLTRTGARNIRNAPADFARQVMVPFNRIAVIDAKKATGKS